MTENIESIFFHCSKYVSCEFDELSPLYDEQTQVADILQVGDRK